MYDNVCKYLAETFSTDFSRWLLNRPIALTQLDSSELPLEATRADCLILQQAEDVVLHVEFQTAPDKSIPFRMADYRLRVYRRYPQKDMVQVVIYLRKTTSPLVYQTEFRIPNTTHTFNVIRLWEQPTDVFLSQTGLLPFAVLGQSDRPEASLNRVAEAIAKIDDVQLKSTLTASTAILAGLVLEKDKIKRILSRETMRESVIFQDIWEEAAAEGRQAGWQEGRQEGLQAGRQEGLQAGRQEGLQAGRQEGLQEGRQEGLQEGLVEARQQVALKLLRFGMSLEQIAEITDLTIAQIEELQNQLS